MAEIKPDKEKRFLEERIAANLSVSLTDNGAILIRIPNTILEKIRAKEPLEPVSEGFKFVSTVHVVEGFKFSEAAVVSDRDGRHLEIFMVQPRYLHIWFDTKEEKDIETYGINNNIASTYEEVFTSDKHNVHTFVWDTDILRGETGYKEKNIVWEDVFIHYNTYDDKGELGSRVDSFNLWATEHAKDDDGNKVELLQKFISTIAYDNFHKLRESGMFIPKRTREIKYVYDSYNENK